MSSDENGDNSSTPAPMVIDATTLEENRNLLSHSGTELQGDLGNGAESKAASNVAKKNRGIHINSANSKPFDIVSAAFADAEIEQFDPGNKNNQDDNDNSGVLGTDILNAAGALADNQEASFGAKFRNFEGNSSKSNSSSENTSTSFEFHRNTKNTRTSSINSNEVNLVSVQENSEGHYMEEYDHNAHGMFQQNADVGDEFLDNHAANNEGTNIEEVNPPTMVIRSVKLTQKVTNYENK